MTRYVIAPSPVPSVAIEGSDERFPIHRIYCVGRNYADHIREMGGDPKRQAPLFFAKPADAVVASGDAVPYPPRTSNFHHEIELVVALGRGGKSIARERALEHVFGYAVGNDFTRRDLQHSARAAGQPWDTSKGFDHSAAVSALRPAARVPALAGRIWLAVNGTLRQEADIAEMIWKVPEIIAELSTYYELVAGDLVYTGTPAGIGALERGDRITGGIDGIGTLENTIV